MAIITHFSHEHPLILLKQLPPEEAKLVCYGCEKPLSQEEHDSQVYRCEICQNFFLHKSCTELPMEIMHGSHEQHPLLLSIKPDYYDFAGCDLCFRRVNGFLYHCSLCEFDLDIECALEKKGILADIRKDLILNHASHKQHQLKLQPRPSSFLCDACEVKDEDVSYQCTSCFYWIHRRCAMLPNCTTNHDIHTHPLSLSFSLPTEYHTFKYFCGICGILLHRRQRLWLYCCRLCRFFVHVKCMATKKQQIEVDLEPLLKDGLPLRFPMSDKSVELIQRFLLKDNSHGNVQPEISIFSHKHPLIYSNNKQIIEDANEDGEEVLCDGCVEPIISPPYYHCAECRYFLHLPCAGLPHELQHPRHQHPLILTSKSRFYESFECNRCKRHSNGFFFCFSAEGCHFYLDVKCAALPKLVEHETHDHPLLEMMPTTFLDCNGCDNLIWDRNFFGCDSCRFYLHGECLMLPKTIKHRFDSKHHLTLRFPPHSYHPRPFDCAQCETEINPNFWLYHCEECDLSFHTECINTAWKYYNSKFGQRLQVGCHPHPLKYVFEASVNSPCHGCRTSTKYSRIFECETCNFHLCIPCVRKVKLKK